VSNGQLKLIVTELYKDDLDIVGCAEQKNYESGTKLDVGPRNEKLK
jgi:hypothetical protein